MGEIKIVTVLNKKELMQFIKFPWEIYKDNDYWVPPLISERKDFLNKRKNPFFRHADAEYFMAIRDGEIVGRIAAIRNDLHNQVHNEKAGFFGMFECINDQEVANKLFDAAIEWCRKRELNKVYGPASLSSNDEWGMLMEGFDDSPRILIPYNLPYYNDLCQNYGFEKAKDLQAWKMTKEGTTSSEKVKRVSKIAQERAGMTIRRLNMKNFEQELETFKELYNKTWEPNWGFVPLTDEEIDYMAKELKPLVDPDFVIFGEIDGKEMAAALPVLDYNYILKRLNGRLFPFGWLKFLFLKRKIKWIRIITLGILPKYQKKGLDGVLFREIIDTGVKKGIEYAEASWVLEDNEMMTRGLKLLGAEPYKRYRVYEKSIG